MQTDTMEFYGFGIRKTRERKKNQFTFSSMNLYPNRKPHKRGRLIAQFYSYRIPFNLSFLTYTHDEPFSSIYSNKVTYFMFPKMYSIDQFTNHSSKIFSCQKKKKFIPTNLNRCTTTANLSIHFKAFFAKAWRLSFHSSRVRFGIFCYVCYDLIKKNMLASVVIFVNDWFVLIPKIKNQSNIYRIQIRFYIFTARLEYTGSR